MLLLCFYKSLAKVYKILYPTRVFYKKMSIDNNYTNYIFIYFKFNTPILLFYKIIFITI